MTIQEKINELFVSCSGSSGSTDFRAVSRVLWMCLNNSVSIVDLAGVFTVSIPGNGMEVLSADLFTEFIKAFARLKYPTSPDFCDALLEEIRGSQGFRLNTDNPSFSLMMDKTVVRVLLKYDLPLRKAYSNFCGQSVRVGGILSWDEVKNLAIGMEIDGFISFAGSYSLVPEHVSTEQCELLFREVLTRYPLIANGATQGSDILFPQFQLLMIMIAVERAENSNRKENDKGANKSFAKKVVDVRSRPVADSLQDLLKDIGISKFDNTALALPATDTHSAASRAASETQAASMNSSHPRGKDLPNHTVVKYSSTNKDNEGEHNLFAGTVVVPATEKPADMHTSALNHSRQAMMLRLEHLFDEVEAKVLEITPPDSEIVALLSTPKEDIVDTKIRLPSKPVVIGDALPVPSLCPETVEQLLEASLAHHNLGSFEESLKFLEAGRIQLADIERRLRDKEKIQSNTQATLNTVLTAEEEAENKLMYMDLDMYITLCKGNVYQSCGDDEQSLLHYLEGWTTAKKNNDKDWEIISLNSIGMLAYYNLRYDVSLLCFHAVVQYRESAYGEENPDTATAWNNEACCLYCLDKRGEARVRFEKAWNTISRALGHRAPRAVTAWKNLEKARRSHAPIHNKKDLKESMELRPDADRLLLGGTFTIQALPPPEGSKKKKGKKGGSKKKKKK